MNKKEMKEYQRKWREAHKEEIKIKRRKRYLKNKDSELAQQKEWRKNNPDWASEWRKNNPERVKELSDKWKKDHPDYAKMSSRKARKKRTDHCVYGLKVNYLVVYLGSSDDIQDRLANHRYYAKQGKDAPSQKKLYQYLQDNGFKVVIIEKGIKDKTTRLKREQYWINKYTPKFNKNKAVCYAV